MEKTKKLKIAIFIFFIIVIIVNAWLCDDAYISFRVIKNFIDGLGLRWNTFERVQVFTNPLMVLMLIPFYAITHEIYYTAIIFDIIISSLALYVLFFKISKNNWNCVLYGIILLFSKSFISFTTSGLENCLTFLLLSLFFYFLFKKDQYLKKDILILSFISSLILLNRMDSILLVIPAWFYILYKKDKNINILKFIFYFIVGMIPFIAWETFALIYYGFLFPNTYYAKLTTGISKIDYMKNGVLYLSTTLILDPATLLTIIFGSLLLFIDENKKMLTIVIGNIIFLIYIIYVGGDFMLGRFLTPALFITTIGLANIEKNIFKEKINNLIISILSLAFIVFTIFYPRDLQYYQFLNGVANEQLYYFNATSLLKVGSEKYIKDMDYSHYAYKKDKIYLFGNIGFAGYFAKNDVIFIDPFALADPLLARIPLKNPLLDRIGHIKREIPNGYLKSIETGKNVIKDENLKKFYDVIKIITQEKIFSKKRIKTIIKYHLGKYDYLIDNYLKNKEI